MSSVSRNQAFIEVSACPAVKIGGVESEISRIGGLGGTDGRRIKGLWRRGGGSGRARAGAE